MALTVPTQEHKYFALSQFVESACTTEVLRGLWEAFYTPESNARRIKQGPFLAAIRAVVASTQLSPADAALVCREHVVHAWFHALDTDSNGWVEWRDFEAALSLAAAMRKYPTVLQRPSKISTSPCAFPGGTKCTWIPSWRRLVTCYNSSTLKVCASDGSAVAELSHHTSCATGFTFLSDLEVLLTFGCDRVVAMWDHRRSSGVVTHANLPIPANIATYDPMRKRIWIATHDGYFRAFTPNLEPLNIKSVDHHDDWVTDATYVEEISSLWTASLDRTLGVWDFASMTLVSRKSGHTRGVHQLCYMKQARLMFSIGRGREICAWNPFSPDDAPLQVLHGHEREMVGIVADACNRTLLSADCTGRIVLWDVPSFTKTQIVELSGLLKDTYLIFQVVQNPLTREVLLISATHIYHVYNTLASQRLPKLGHRVRFFAACESCNTFIVAFSQAIHLFDMVTSGLLRSLERPYGPAASIQYLGVDDRMHIFWTQTDHGRVFYHNLSAERPLPANTAAPSPLALRAATSCSPWIHSQWWTESYLNRSVYRLLVVQADGTCTAQSYTAAVAAGNASAITLQSTSKPATTTTTVELNPAPSPSAGAAAERKGHGGAPSSTAEGAGVIVVRASSGTVESDAGDDVLLCTSRGEVMVWNCRTGAAMPLTKARCNSGSSPALDVLCVPGRNAWIVLFADGFSLLCGPDSWIPIVDYHYRDFPELTELERKEDVDAAALLSSDDMHFSFTRCVLLHDETLCLITNYVGRVVLVSLANVFARFFGAQTVPLEATDMLTSSFGVALPPSSSDATEKGAGEAVWKAVGIPSDIKRSLVPKKINAFVSPTSSIHDAVDTRNHEPLIVKVHVDYRRFVQETAARRAFANSPWFVRTAWMNDDASAVSAVSDRRGVDLSTSAIEGEQREGPAADDGECEDGVEPLAQARGGGRQLPHSNRCASHPITPIVMEHGEEVLSNLIPSAAPISAEPWTERQSLLSDSEVFFVIGCLVHQLTAMHDASFVSTDYRPRSIYRVGDMWKLISLDSVVPFGSPVQDPVSAVYCPPELCRVVAAKTTKTETLRDVPANPHQTTVWTPSANVWTLGIIAHELFHRRRSTAHSLRMASAKSMSASAVSTLTPFAHVLSITDEDTQLLRESVPRNSAAGIVLDCTLRLDPKQRCTAAEILRQLECAGFVVKLDRLLLRHSIFRSGTQNSLPKRLVVGSVSPLTIPSSADETNTVTLPRCGVLTHMVSLLSVACFACCDKDPWRSNEGVLHLYNMRGAHLGFLPPPEFGGQGSGSVWTWPGDYGESGGRGDAGISADDAPLGLDAPPMGGGGGGPSYDLSPPKGWLKMDLSSLSETLKESATSSVLDFHGRFVSVQEAVDMFAKRVVRKAPFFRGGELVGDPMPLYAPEYMKHQTRSSKTSTGGSSDGGDDSGQLQRSNKDSTFTIRKWAKYWNSVEESMKEQCIVEAGGPTAAAGRASQGSKRVATFPKSFLREMPTTSTPEDPLVSEVQSFFFATGDPFVDGEQSPWVGGRDSPHRHANSALQDVHEGAIRRHRQRVKDELRTQSSFRFSDNALSSIDRGTRAQLQNVMASREGRDVLRTVERDLEAGRRRLEEREKAKRDAAAKREALFGGRKVPTDSAATTRQEQQPTSAQATAS